MVYKKDASGSWVKVGDRGATSITVDADGNPWITDVNNEIWRWSGGKWVRVQGRARQIAIGADGSVFALDNIKASDGYGVWKLDQTKLKWNKVGQGALEITVGADGKPYIINGIKGEIMWPDEPCNSGQIEEVLPEVEEPAATAFTVSRKWVGLRRSTDCDVGSKCEGYDLRGRYQVDVKANGDSVLRISGLLTWQGDGRKKD